MLVIGEIDVTTFSFSIIDVVLSLVLLIFDSEARESENDVITKLKNTRHNDKITIAPLFIAAGSFYLEVLKILLLSYRDS
jgi:hypothetical protein